MRPLFALVWCATLATATESGDWGIAINFGGVALMGLIGYLIRRSVADIETDIKHLWDESRNTNRRVRIIELNIERIAAKNGVKVRRFVDQDATAESSEDEE